MKYCLTPIAWLTRLFTPARTPIHLYRLAPLAVSLAIAVSSAAQSPPGIAIQTHAGLTITGDVGAVYAIQSTSSPQLDDWTCLTFVRLPATSYQWIDPAPALGQRIYRAEFADPTNMAFIPPGTFRSGSGSGESGRSTNESPRARVTLTKGFFMGRNLVTQGDYLALMGVNPSHFTAAVVTNNPVYSTNQPVESVSWFDATNYCDKLTRQELAAQRIPAGSRFRLPTEAEWEYACRSYTSTRFSFGDADVDSDLSPFGWFSGNNNKSPRAVGLLKSNPFGLYDMHGNVFEWCQDWYGVYPGGEIIDPQGPTTGTMKVVRGGNFNSQAWACRSAMRDNRDPVTKSGGIGFRVVLADTAQ